MLALFCSIEDKRLGLRIVDAMRKTSDTVLAHPLPIDNGKVRPLKQIESLLKPFRGAVVVLPWSSNGEWDASIEAASALSTLRPTVALADVGQVAASVACTEKDCPIVWFERDAPVSSETVASLYGALSAGKKRM